MGEPGIRGTRPRGCLKGMEDVRSGSDEEDAAVSLRNWTRWHKIIGHESLRDD